VKNALNLSRRLRRRPGRPARMTMDGRMLADVGIGWSQIDLYLSGACGR